MPAFHTGTVTEILAERAGLQRVLVDLAAAGRGDTAERAYVLTALTGRVEIGHRVVVNTTAVDLALGTGGWHVVHWNLEQPSFVERGPGHIMKLRYTSLQADTGAAEEDDPEVASDLGGMPVLVCGLHSQMAVAAAVVHHEAPDVRLVYVMTDGAALPYALSDLAAALRAKGVIHRAITAGNAFGGDVEAVTVPSALAWARHRLGAHAAVVAMGPGITGTGSRLGTTGLEVASILDQVASLGGQPVLALRVSDGDPRTRHQGMSHHSGTVLDLLHAPVVVPVADPIEVPPPHRAVELPSPDVGAILTDLDLVVTTMGRHVHEDPAFFRAAGVAGSALARLAAGTAL